MAEVTREDISKVHSRLDDLVEEQTLSRIAIGKIETHLKLMPAPKPRPCKELQDHIETHKESRRLWQKPIVGMLIHLIELGLVAVVTWYFVG